MQTTKNKKVNGKQKEIKILPFLCVLVLSSCHLFEEMFCRNYVLYYNSIVSMVSLFFLWYSGKQVSIPEGEDHTRFAIVVDLQVGVLYMIVDH